MPIDWNIAIKYARLVQLAENIPPAGDNNRLKADLTADPHADEIVSFGFLALSPAFEFVAAIRGNDTISEWLHDGAFQTETSPISGLVEMTEDGFTANYKGLRIDKAPGSTVKAHLTAGQAKTADVALNTPCKIPVSYAFASPRTGDHLFANGDHAIVSALRFCPYLTNTHKPPESGIRRTVIE